MRIEIKELDNEIHVEVEIDESVKENGRVAVTTAHIRKILLDKGIKFGIIKQGRSWILSNQTNRRGTFIFEATAPLVLPVKKQRPRRKKTPAQDKKRKAADVFKPSKAKQED